MTEFAQHELPMVPANLFSIWRDRFAELVLQDELTLASSPDAPLVVRVATDREVLIKIENGVNAHLILIGDSENCSVNITAKENAKLFVYFAPMSFAQKLIFNGYIMRDACMRMFEMGAFAPTCERKMTVHLKESKAQFDYVGLDQLCGVQNKDSQLVIKHQARDTKSTQLFRGIYGDSANANFIGQVVIEKNASDSSAQQLYKAIMIGDKAKARVLPELVIHNHDISASHGATIGELDKEALFYLCTRGLPLDRAKSMLIESITEEMLSTIGEPTLRDAFTLSSQHATSSILKRDAS